MRMYSGAGILTSTIFINRITCSRIHAGVYKPLWKHVETTILNLLWYNRIRSLRLKK